MPKPSPVPPPVMSAVWPVRLKAGFICVWFTASFLEHCPFRQAVILKIMAAHSTRAEAR